MYKKNISDMALRSRIRISDALFRIMQNEKYNEVTILHLCEEAGLASKTYYRNFDSKEEIIYFYYDRLVSSLTDECDSDTIDIRSFLHKSFTFFGDHHDVLKATEYNDLWHMLRDSISSGILSFRCLLDIAGCEDMDEPEAYSSVCVAGVIVSTLKLWTEHDFKESVEKLTALADIMLSGDK